MLFPARSVCVEIEVGSDGEADLGPMNHTSPNHPPRVRVGPVVTCGLSDAQSEPWLQLLWTCACLQHPSPP
jgi:hypothetical protein